MSVRITGDDDLIKRLKAIGEPRPLLRQLQLAAVAEAKALVPRQTGHLARSIVPGSISGTSALVEARTPYAGYVEFGTAAHTIRPRKAATLAWPANASGRRLSGRRRTNSGRLIFAKQVRHPGTKAQPYLVPGAKAALLRGGFRDIVVRRWNRAA